MNIAGDLQGESKLIQGGAEVSCPAHRTNRWSVDRRPSACASSTIVSKNPIYSSAPSTSSAFPTLATVQTVKADIPPKRCWKGRLHSKPCVLLLSVANSWLHSSARGSGVDRRQDLRSPASAAPGPPCRARPPPRRYVPPRSGQESTVSTAFVKRFLPFARTCH